PAHYKDVLMHRIDGGQALENFTAASKSSTDKGLIHSLRDLGMACGKEWLAKRFDALGVKSTVNIARDYLDDLRMPVEKAEPAQIEPPPPEPPPVFLPGAGLL
ncbi:MAG: patatin-like phospholipase family protein, partial [Polaromonas sp.]|nr:patatin-like phospholipase family protein [Polaromonas sp.]